MPLISASRFQKRITKNCQCSISIPRQPLSITICGDINYDDSDDSDDGDENETIVCACGASVPSTETVRARDLVRICLSCEVCSKAEGATDSPPPCAASPFAAK